MMARSGVQWEPSSLQRATITPSNDSSRRSLRIAARSATTSPVCELRTERFDTEAAGPGRFVELGEPRSSLFLRRDHGRLD